MTAGGALTSRRVRMLRPSKRPMDASRPLGYSWEEERSVEGHLLPTLTVFLAGAECPFSCVFCDLWQHTLDGPTPAGAIPGQIALAIAEAGAVPEHSSIKLYNASNFFDSRSVPVEDDTAIIPLLAPFERVIVESHPRFIAQRCLDLAERLDGTLEVAMGLETVHPDVFPRLNKGMTLEDFDRAADFLAKAHIALRAFVLVAPPFMPDDAVVEWAVRSTRYAVEHGAEHVSLIPVRGGNGTLDELRRTGEWIPPKLNQVEDALEATLGLGGAVTADLWDIDSLATCECGPARIARLSHMNTTGAIPPRESCARCGWQ